VNGEQVVTLIKKLKEYGILKTYYSKKKGYAQLAESAEEVIAPTIAGDTKYRYAFNFVGVLFVAVGEKEYKKEYLLKCYPKYIKEYTEDRDNAKFKTVLRVLAKFNKAENITLYGETHIKDYAGRIAVMLELLNNYWEYGIYKNEKDILEDNGSGEIDWERTIGGTTAIIAENRPYYVNLQTRRTVGDEYDYFTRLHKSILKECSEELRVLDLFALFGDLSPVELTDEILPDFGDADYIDYRIGNELNIQFNTQRQYVLRLMRAYLGVNEQYRSDDEFKMFGTTSFHGIWEDVCKSVLGDCLKQPQPNYQNRKLLELIRKPKWTLGGGICLTDTLIPDLICIQDNRQGNVQGDVQGKRFYIFDAKYYDIEISEDCKTVTGQPGLESITKQFLYELAYYNVDDNAHKNFFETSGITEIKNCFLFPCDGGGGEGIYDRAATGRVSFDIFGDDMMKKGLQNILVRKVYAPKFYEAYLSGKRIDIANLELGK
jgi:hypothetical protein